jgi:hypothetical protein
MKMKIALAAALALTAAAPAVARSPVEPAQKPERQCFFARNVNSFAAVNENIVNVRVGVRDVYQFEMFGPCQDVDWANRVALVSRGSSSICTGMDAEIVTETGIGPQRCLVRNIRKLTPAEVEALPRNAKP